MPGKHRMPLTKYTQSNQELLAEYCRTGVIPSGLDGIVPTRLPHYRRLVINVVRDALSQAYPLTEKLLGVDRFVDLVAEFFAKHNCQEAQLYKMTGELLVFFTNNPDHTLLIEYPCLMDLLRFEWLEMEMYMMEDAEMPVAKPDGDWLNDCIILNPEHRLLKFDYPVFKVAPQELAAYPASSYFCMAYRQPETLKIIFTEVSAVMAAILELMGHGETLSTIYKILQSENINLSDTSKHQLLEYLQEQLKTGFVLGFGPS